MTWDVIDVILLMVIAALTGWLSGFWAGYRTGRRDEKRLQPEAKRP